MKALGIISSVAFTAILVFVAYKLSPWGKRCVPCSPGQPDSSTLPGAPVQTLTTMQSGRVPSTLDHIDFQ